VAGRVGRNHFVSERTLCQRLIVVPCRAWVGLGLEYFFKLSQFLSNCGIFFGLGLERDRKSGFNCLSRHWLCFSYHAAAFDPSSLLRPCPLRTDAMWRPPLLRLHPIRDNWPWAPTPAPPSEATPKSNDKTRSKAGFLVCGVEVYSRFSGIGSVGGKVSSSYSAISVNACQSVLPPLPSMTS